MANVIVVGVDGGEPALRAARRAAELAAALGASFMWSPRRPRHRRGDPGATRQQTSSPRGRSPKPPLPTWRVSLRAWCPSITFEVLHDKPAVALVAEAERWSAS